jgi:hypothetical protein
MGVFRLPAKKPLGDVQNEGADIVPLSEQCAETAEITCGGGIHLLIVPCSIRTQVIRSGL